MIILKPREMELVTQDFICHNPWNIQQGNVTATCCVWHQCAFHAGVWPKNGKEEWDIFKLFFRTKSIYNQQTFIECGLCLILSVLSRSCQL